jgi:hypothetical protein
MKYLLLCISALFLISAAPLPNKGECKYNSFWDCPKKVIKDRKGKPIKIVTICGDTCEWKTQTHTIKEYELLMEYD